MLFRNSRAFAALAIASMAMTACGGAGMTSMPASQPVMGNAQHLIDSGGVMPAADSTSILKKLKKDVTIGSTVDPKNGDKGPRAITVVPVNYGKLKKNQIAVCNFEDSKGTAGNGTSIEILAAAANSKPVNFVSNAKIKGCDGTSLTSGDQMYASGMTSGDLVWINQSGQIKKTYGNPFTMPIADVETPQLYLYSPIYIFAGNADSGTIVNLSLGNYGTGHATEIINGFPVNKGKGWDAEGPSGFAYSCGQQQPAQQCHNKNDTLYVADGDCNAIVAIDHVSSLLLKDEITVGSGCTSFTCLYPSTSCGKVVKTGSPLNKPFAATILANGNMIVANTGNNTLVELMPTGKVLATKVVDKSKTPGIYSIYAVGTNDANTALYYTDTNSNELHKLEQ
ncbi:MAG TPA: hypothetical protein VHX17_06400 [Candidatus Cybelea sp.]|jgi:hypothetical protein|nr:hypothetical protein [Candidatus Cybelea sp.]